MKPSPTIEGRPPIVTQMAKYGRPVGFSAYPTHDGGVLVMPGAVHWRVTNYVRRTPVEEISGHTFLVKSGQFRPFEEARLYEASELEQYKALWLALIYDAASGTVEHHMGEDLMADIDQFTAVGTFGVDPDAYHLFQTFILADLNPMSRRTYWKSDLTPIPEIRGDIFWSTGIEILPP